MASAEELRLKGNEYYRAQKYTEAVQCYTDALKLSPQDPVILSNRSGAYWKLKEYVKALKDAEECIVLKSDWAKAHMRKVVALSSLKEFKRSKDAAVVGFKLYDLNLCKDFVSEWIKSSKAQMDPEICSILQKKPYVFFYPDGIDSFCDEYNQILFQVVVVLMPSQNEGVIGLSHLDMVYCVEGAVKIMKSVLTEFGQPDCKALMEWKERVVMDVDAFQFQSQKELMDILNEKSLALASWLQNEAHPALLAILSPTLLLVPVALLARSLALRCMNTGQFSLEYFAHACLAFFEDSLYDHPRYYSTFVELLFLILFSYGSVEIWDLKALELVQVTCVKIQRLMEDMPKETKGYHLHMEEFSSNLSVFLNMKITQISESTFKHNPTGAVTDLENILAVCTKDSVEARRAVDERLAEIMCRDTSSDSQMKLLDAQSLLLMTGIYIKLGDCEKALEVFQKGKIMGLSLIANLIQNAVATLSEMSSAVADLRHFTLCAASFLIGNFPTLAADAFIQWKNLFSEVHTILIRLGLRANNRVLFQLLDDPLLLESGEEQLKAFHFHQSIEKSFIQKYFSCVLQSLVVQSHKQVLDALEPGDALLDYIFDVYHPDFNPDEEPRNDPICFATLLIKDSTPTIFQLDLSSVHEKYSCKGGQGTPYEEICTLCSTLGEHIFPSEFCKLVEEGKVNRLLISPDSYLHDLPLEAISTKFGRPDAYLFEKFDVLRLSSPRELLREQVVASLQLLFNPSLDFSQPSSVPDDAVYSKLLGVIRSSDIQIMESPETLIAEVFRTCGLQSQLPKVTSPIPDPNSLDVEIPLLTKTGEFTLPVCSKLSPVLLKALQNAAKKNTESLKSRAASLEKQSKGMLNPKTKSLTVDCYLIGNPQFDTSAEPIEEDVELGCIAALTKMFWFMMTDPDAVKFKVTELPETQREIDAVEYHLSLSTGLQVKQPMVGSKATVASLLELESPFILHIATHGHLRSLIHTQAHMSYWSDTSTALLLAGAQTYLNKQHSKLSFHSGLGCLTPASTCAINLQGTRLVFSSSCHSGVGTKPFHETSQSMMQAFHAAGAQTVISTLWAVDDSLAADFASFFYDQLIKKSTCRPSEGLTLARKLLKDRQEPLSAWGAFICSGIDQPLFPLSTTKAQEIQMVADYVHANKLICVGEGLLTGSGAKKCDSRLSSVAGPEPDSKLTGDST